MQDIETSMEQIENKIEMHDELLHTKTISKDNFAYNIRVKALAINLLCKNTEYRYLAIKRLITL